MVKGRPQCLLLGAFCLAGRAASPGDAPSHWHQTSARQGPACNSAGKLPTPSTLPLSWRKRHSNRPDRACGLNHAEHTSHLVACALARMRASGKASMVAFGGSVTWGASVETSHGPWPTWPNLLAARFEASGGIEAMTVRNLAIRAAGAEAPALCTEPLLTIGHDGMPFSDRYGQSCGHSSSAPAEPVDIVGVEFSVNGINQLDLLLANVRRRYPNAIIVYVQHIRHYDIPLSEGEQGNGTCPLPDVLQKWLAQAPGALVFSMLTALQAHPMHESMRFYRADRLHLSATGHSAVADGVWEAIHAAAAHSSREASTSSCPVADLSPEADPDRHSRCWIWYTSGVVEGRGLSVAGSGWALRHVREEVTKFALQPTGEVVGEARPELELSFNITRTTDVYLAFMRDEASYGVVNVTLGRRAISIDGSPQGYGHGTLLNIQKVGRLRQLGRHRLGVLVIGDANRSRFAVCGLILRSV